MYSVQVAADLNYDHSTRPPKKNPTIRIPRWCAPPRPRSRTPPATHGSGGGAAAVSVANALPGAAADRPAATPARIHFGPYRGDHQLRDFQEGHHFSTQDGGNVKKACRWRWWWMVRANAPQPTNRAPQPKICAKINDLVKSAIGYRRQRAATRCRSPTCRSPGWMTPADTTPATKPLLGLDSSYWFKIIEASIMCLTALADRPVRRPPADKRACLRPQWRGQRPQFADRQRFGAHRRRAARTRRRSRQRAHRRWHNAGPACAQFRCNRHQPLSIGQVRDNPRSRKLVKWLTRILKKRWRSSAPGCINRYNHVKSLQKPMSEDDVRSLTGAERAGVIMLARWVRINSEPRSGR